jgi:hypothetical protein
MKQYPYIKVVFNGNVFTLFVNGEKYATTYTTEVLSDCINEAIKDYLEEA